MGQCVAKSWATTCHLYLNPTVDMNALSKVLSLSISS
jgi:hypothetical protein